MSTATIYLKDREEPIIIYDVENILGQTGDVHNPFVPVSPYYMFFDDDKNYIFNAKHARLFIRGSIIQCAICEDSNAEANS